MNAGYTFIIVTDSAADSGASSPLAIPLVSLIFQIVSETGGGAKFLEKISR